MPSSCVQMMGKYFNRIFLEHSRLVRGNDLNKLNSLLLLEHILISPKPKQISWQWTWRSESIFTCHNNNSILNWSNNLRSTTFNLSSIFQFSFNYHFFIIINTSCADRVVKLKPREASKSRSVLLIYQSQALYVCFSIYTAFIAHPTTI